MAKKKLNLLDDDTEINYSGTTAGAIMTPIDLIQTRDAFKNMYRIKSEDYDRIKASVEKNGFNPNHGISCWSIFEDDEEQLIVLDGHTRLCVCKDLGFFEIPVHKYQFDSEKDALLWAYGEQLNRRQLTDADLFASFSVIDEIQNPGRKKSSDSDDKEDDKPVDSTADTAQLLNVSKRQVSKMRNIQKNGDEETKAAVASGKLTINQADKKTNEKKKSQKSSNNENEDALDDNSGNPAATFVHQRENEHNPTLVTPSETELDRWEIEKNKQVETASAKAYAKGFEMAVYYSLSEQIKGKSAKEIFDSLASLSPSGLTDFSPNVISKFKLPEDAEEIVNNL